jgi:hypothetical protein
MEIPFRIRGIKTLQYAIFPEELRQGSIQVESKYEFGANIENRFITCCADFNYKQEDRLILVLKIACHFEIEQKGFESFNEKGQFRIPADFLRYMGTITVGAARGIIHAKTEGTSINPIVLPPINLVETIKDDYIIK